MRSEWAHEMPHGPPTLEHVEPFVSEKHQVALPRALARVHSFNLLHEIGGQVHFKILEWLAFISLAQDLKRNSAYMAVWKRFHVGHSKTPRLSP